MEKTLYQNYVALLHKELIPAMGCTEPIAVAYAASIARKQLQSLPTKVCIKVSGNIIKNVKSVIVPNTGGLKGIEAAVAAGIVAGDSNRELEVIAGIKPEEKVAIKEYKEATPIEVEECISEQVLDIQIHVYTDTEEATVRIAGTHTNVVSITHNGVELLVQPGQEEEQKQQAQRQQAQNQRTQAGQEESRKSKKDSAQSIEQEDRGINFEITVKDIVEFADTVEIVDIIDCIRRQIEYNKAIAEEGIKGNYGAKIGKILLDCYGDSVENKAKAMAAAGSDARMSGCELPVVINSGSGNQGMAVSIPLIVYAEELDIDREKLYRALVVSNLVAIHLKKGIGCLSAYCGAISAGCGASAGIAYLTGGDLHMINHTIVNCIAINSGVICDGAKPSCAAKINSAIEAGLLGMNMAKEGSQFYDGDGIVRKGVENTIYNVGKIARDGMKQTDKEIIKIMVKQ